MKTLEVLRKARELISKPEHWTRHKYARDVRGLPAPVHDEAAFCFCALGALRKVNNKHSDFCRPATVLASALPESITSVSVFNDTRTHAEVLALFDKAICMEEAKLSG